MIVSSEFDKTPDEIIDIYRGLWRIEETYRSPFFNMLYCIGIIKGITTQT